MSISPKGKIRKFTHANNKQDNKILANTDNNKKVAHETDATILRR